MADSIQGSGYQAHQGIPTPVGLVDRVAVLEATNAKLGAELQQTHSEINARLYNLERTLGVEAPPVASQSVPTSGFVGRY